MLNDVKKNILTINGNVEILSIEIETIGRNSWKF